MGFFNRIFGNRAARGGASESRDASAPTSNAAARERGTEAVDRISRGLEKHQAGDLQSAEAGYREALDLEPDHSDAHYLLGSLLGQTGRLDEALEHLRQAARLDPSAGAALSDMGNVYRVQGRLEEAEAAYRGAIEVDDEFPNAYRNLADLLSSQGRVDEAIECLARAASLTADDPDSHFLLADLLSHRGRYQEACRSYRAGLSIAPESAAAHNNLGASLRHLSRDQEARACFEEALRLDFNLGDAHVNLADMLRSGGFIDKAIEHYRAAAELQSDSVHCRRSLGQLLLAEHRVDEALRYYREVLTLEPESTRSHFELGNALVAGGQVDEAIERLGQAVRLDPEDPNAHVNLGYALNTSKRFEEARQCFHQALILDPELVEAHNNLGGVLQMQGQLRPAMQSYERALELTPDQFYVRSNYLTCLNYHDESVPEDVFKQHRDWSELIARETPPPEAVHIPQPDPERRLRIGYVSADLRYHSVAFFMAPLLECHDREHFEITCYAQVATPDANTQRLKALSDNWRDIARLSDAEVAAWIRRDAIDVLVDLSGHTVGNRLPVFAQRPAPVQVTYLGYPNTTGLEMMDYRLTDALSDPPGRSDRLHTEELVRIDEGFLCYQPLESCPDVRESRASDAGTGITFASFNELLKVTPPTVAAWCEILQRTPGSKLIIKGTTLEDDGTRQRVVEGFVEAGLEAERLQLIGRTQTLEQHLELYNSVDIALDTFPYNGTTTTCEALWMGVPVVSQSGDVHASRVGFSLLSNVELDDLVADNVQDYVDTAVKLAADHERRARLRKGLRDRMRGSALMDGKGFTRRIESAYREMWRRACQAANDSQSVAGASNGAMTVAIKGGIHVHLPIGVEELTPYVLVEQEDWFEDEIHFVRHMLRPGMRCLDIGANYGVFSLSCARQVGSEGRVWSFEPTPGTAEFLSASIKGNGFENVTLMPMALSRDSGTAKLVTHADSEHNYLTDAGSDEDRFEIVDVRSLDDLANEQELENIDFVKMDAEGAEIAILEGGEGFFQRESPVILFELKNREGPNWALVDTLQARGYEIYRLVPGLRVLVPFERDSIDAFQLNLFAVKPDRAQRLEAQALAIRSLSPDASTESAAATDLSSVLARLPYAASLASGWRDWLGADGGDSPQKLVSGLTSYCRARDESLPMADRVAALRQAHSHLSQPQGSSSENARLYSLARVAWELGYRQQAVDALNAICAKLDSRNHTPDSAPFLAVSERFDIIEPGDAFADWCLASVLDQRERLSAFSSYFQDERVLASLEMLGHLPFQCAEMERRRQLVRIRLGQQAAPEPTPLLAQASEDNLNPGFWTSAGI
ncbi:MAG: FkbM family methyltransferase [Gammaproteobacteria bacterium]|jgi:FkbM family methyltransferase|nr:FkbM family methyltransferase [Gammaproteobacteria bacterium]